MYTSLLRLQQQRWITADWGTSENNRKAKPSRARAVMSNRLRHGDSLPGFGHPRYPAGDPRAALLMRLAETSGNETEWKLVQGLSRAGSELLHDLPNLDFGLVSLARTHGLPDGAPLILFALGRTIGWIAHVIEQYATGELIRPRARYTGLAPEDSGPAGARSGRLNDYKLTPLMPSPTKGCQN